MKRYLIIFIVILFPVWVLCAQYGEFLPDWGFSVQGLWHLNDNSSPETDSSGNGNSGTVSGATYVAGKFNGAYDFNGSSDYINVGSGSSLDLTGDYTIIAWIYPEGWGSGEYGRIFSRTDTDGYTFFIGNATTKQVLIAHYGVTNIYAGSQTDAVSLNTWQCVAVTFQASSTTAAFYNNGEAVNGSGSDLSIDAPVSEEATAYIGSYSGSSSFFDGLIDELIVYTRTLSALEIRELFAVQKGIYGIQ